MYALVTFSLDCSESLWIEPDYTESAMRIYQDASFRHKVVVVVVIVVIAVVWLFLNAASQLTHQPLSHESLSATKPWCDLHDFNSVWPLPSWSRALYQWNCAADVFPGFTWISQYHWTVVWLLPGTASPLYNVTISRLVTGYLLFCQSNGYDYPSPAQSVWIKPALRAPWPLAFNIRVSVLGRGVGEAIIAHEVNRFKYLIAKF
jgi:hypothetical protein